MTGDREGRDCDPVLARLLVLQSCKAAWFWLPTSFLLFASRFGSETALTLLGAYYLAGVVLELPSGWASDRFGRRATLLVAMAMQAAGGCAIAFGESFGWCVAGQVGLAGATAFVSGTDTALLYDWLKRDDRLGELTTWEARVATVGFGTAAVATVSGGFASAWWLGAGYLGTGLAGLVGLVAALGIRDAREPDQVAGGARGDWGRLLGSLRHPRLAWLAAFAVSMQLFNHVPLEFHQAYAALLDVDFLGAGAPTETVGLVLGLMMLLASVASRLSPAVAERCGPIATLLVCFALQISILWAMALFLHPAVLLVIACRGVPHGIALPVRNAQLHAVLSGPLRATFFSGQTLVGSLLLAVTLMVAGRFAGGPLETLARGDLTGVLLTYGVAALVVLGALWLWRPRER
ncbi:Major Facilitator Superfamily protein [Planctomycetes bacterium Pla163]|uniref:Major Facilitator Superfamily protein n=1 Tax=Rohdeia mirabilis TaxID=2528008 RepID=A0A518CW18_9BACT|nr:Major Facilitator Superfamily protein [Planctomycetes bacterium Pla163]